MSKAEHTTEAQKKVSLLVWDLPTRLFHWSLALSFLVAALTMGSDRWLGLHTFAGYFVLALVLFRLVWGFCGGHYSRFAQFRYDWGQVREHLRDRLQGHREHYLSHNPAGSWSVYLILTLALGLSLTGVFLLAGEEEQGVLAFLGPFPSDMLHRTHQYLGYGLIALVGVHLAGVAVEMLLNRENLVRSMLSGYKHSRQRPAIRVRPASATALVMATALVAGLAYSAYRYTRPELAGAIFTGHPLPQLALWNDNCSDCHMAYHPSLLPRRSWQRLLGHQHDHFGEDLFLEADTLKALQRFANANAAETGMTEAARKIAASIPAQQAPERITRTPYWRQKHQGIDDAVWHRDSVRGRGNCQACHTDARQGWFEDGAMRIPAPKRAQTH